MIIKRFLGTSVSALILVGFFDISPLHAQGFGGVGPGARAPQPQPEVKKGPAEEAPKKGSVGQNLSLPPLPSWPGQGEKTLNFIELHGYLRLRGDFQHNHNLGLISLPGRSGSGQFGAVPATHAPFWRPISEKSTLFNCEARGDCPNNTLTGTNMRLRVEPTINVAEQVRIRTQVDIFDNYVLGSTPDSLVAGGRAEGNPLAALSTGQAAPVVGENSNRPSILVKRVWGEVDTPVGALAFGRMPWHWGLGLWANDGNCLDCNFGDNQDRIVFTSLPIYQHVLGIAYDFAANGPHSLNISPRSPGGGQGIDLESLDDIDQWLFFVARKDRPDVLRERIEAGAPVFNYGAALLFRKQDFDIAAASNGTLNRSQEELANAFISRNATIFTTDAWARFFWRNLTIEFEGALVVGDIENAADTPEIARPLDLLQYAFLLRSGYRLLNNTLSIGLEIGMASGDDSELYDLNRRRGSTLSFPGVGEADDNRIIDTKFNEFRFNNDYIVDLILFREIMGTVANAVYFKPSVQYNPWDSIGAKFDIIYSLTPQPLAYPGNASQLGIELDLDLYYRNPEEGFFAGIQYGVLFPLAGLDRPAAIYGADAADASTAQTVQARLGITF